MSNWQPRDRTRRLLGIARAQGRAQRTPISALIALLWVIHMFASLSLVSVSRFVLLAAVAFVSCGPNTVDSVDPDSESSSSLNHRDVSCGGAKHKQCLAGETCARDPRTSCLVGNANCPGLCVVTIDGGSPGGGTGGGSGGTGGGSGGTGGGSGGTGGGSTGGGEG